MYHVMYHYVSSVNKMYFNCAVDILLKLGMVCEITNYYNLPLSIVI